MVDENPRASQSTQDAVIVSYVAVSKAQKAGASGDADCWRSPLR